VDALLALRHNGSAVLIPDRTRRFRCEAGAVENATIQSSYNRNLNAAQDALEKESEVHGGELVARSVDGRETFGYASTYDELFGLLDETQIDQHNVVIARIPAADEACLF
jgi:hypothetical protein